MVEVPTIQRRYGARTPEEGSGARKPSEGTSIGQLRDAPKCRAPENDLAAFSDGNVLSCIFAETGDNDNLDVLKILDRLEGDCISNLQRIRSVPDSLLARARELVAGVTVDLKAPLHPDDD